MPWECHSNAGPPLDRVFSGTGDNGVYYFIDIADILQHVNPRLRCDTINYLPALPPDLIQLISAFLSDSVVERISVSQKKPLIYINGLI